MKALLLATDLSNRSERALHRAAQLVRQFRCPWTVLHVVDADQPQALASAWSAQVHEALASHLGEIAELAGAAPALRVEVGDPAERIVDFARSQGFDLLVMGCHRRNALRDVFVGTTLERVLRTGDTPVLVVNRETEGHYHDILVGLDLSPCSARAAQAARELGILELARSRALYAFEPFARLTLLGAGLSDSALEDHEQREAVAARSALAQFLGEQGLLGVFSQHSAEEGLPITVLRHALQQAEPDLLVLGTRGMSGVKRALIGSVADAALREFDCDMLVVPPAR